jgi:YD repeat-containing protein
VGHNWSNVLNRTYTYSSTQNDGRIETMVDAVSGETVQYQYDSLKRLISAETTGNQWGQSFSYL